jgi:hypothetical protein
MLHVKLSIMRKLLLALCLLLLSSLFSGCTLTDLKLKAGLQVLTNDIPTDIYLDGKFLDKTPYINKELKAGEYMLELRPENTQLATYQTKISLHRGLLTVVTWKPGSTPETSGGVIYEMEKLKNSKDSEISLITIPDGAIIHVDDEAKGFSPVVVEKTSPGEHEYEVSLPSYETQKHTINVLEGYRMNITLQLAKQTYVALSPTPSPSPATSATNAAQLTSSSSASTSTSTTTTAVPVPKPKVKIKPTGFFQNDQEVLRVRGTPSATGKELGFAPVGSEYAYLKVTTDGWYQVSFNGETGWVSAQYAQLFE